MKKLFTTLAVALAVVSMQAQHASMIFNKMYEYSNLVSEKHYVYYNVNEQGKVTDVYISNTLPEKAKKEITTFLQELPKFYGAPGIRMTNILPSAAATSQPSVTTASQPSTQQQPPQTQQSSNKIVIGSFDVKGRDENSTVGVTVASTPVKPREDENKKFDVVEQMPSFPGGQTALITYLSNNVKYPVICEENGAECRVIVQFIVGKDGNISNVQIAKGNDYFLEHEAIRVVKAMPKWIPGKQNGQNIMVRYTLPITFRLQ